VSHGPHDHGDG